MNLLAKSLLNTTFTSTIQSHQTLKHLSHFFGCSEDVISRFAISRSLSIGKIPSDWKPVNNTDQYQVSTGKSLRGKTLFKNDLSLFLVMLATVENDIASENVREFFQLHWERGIEIISNEIQQHDWLEYLGQSINQ